MLPDPIEGAEQQAVRSADPVAAGSAESRGSADPGASEQALDPGAAANDHVWVGTAYFAQGLPYSVVNNLPELLAAQAGASLDAIGLTSLFHLPWNLKFLWAPAVDRIETKRRWVLAMQVALVLIFAATALLAGLSQMGAVAVCFLIAAVVAATQDIAIDGYYLTALAPRAQAQLVSHRAMAYKGASLLVTGPLVLAIGLAIRFGAPGWAVGLLAVSLMMVVLVVVHAALLREPESVRVTWRDALTPRVLVLIGVTGGLAVAIWIASTQLGIADGVRSSALYYAPWLGWFSLAEWITMVMLIALLALALGMNRLRARLRAAASTPWRKSMVDFLDRPQVARILAFVVLFRLGESLLMKMKYPFLKADYLLTLDAYGLINGTFGVAFSFAGTMLGGMLIARHGLARWLWPFVLAQNVINLAFVGLAVFHVDGMLGTATIAVVVCIEQFGAGLGTAVFMVYMLRCCDEHHRAAHMAILTALMSVSFTVAGVVSGALAARLGFPAYFTLCTVATVPAMLLLPWLPGLEHGPVDREK